MSAAPVVLLDVVPGWMRIKPSGYVHLLVRASPGGIQETACGRRLAADRLTADYPPRTKRCPACVATV